MTQRGGKPVAHSMIACRSPLVVAAVSQAVAGMARRMNGEQQTINNGATGFPQSMSRPK
jgi:hypothetical protein